MTVVRARIRKSPGPFPCPPRWLNWIRAPVYEIGATRGSRCRSASRSVSRPSSSRSKPVVDPQGRATRARTPLPARRPAGRRSDAGRPRARTRHRGAARLRAHRLRPASGRRRRGVELAGWRAGTALRLAGRLRRRAQRRAQDGRLRVPRHAADLHVPPGPPPRSTLPSACCPSAGIAPRAACSRTGHSPGRCSCWTSADHPRIETRRSCARRSRTSCVGSAARTCA